MNKYTKFPAIAIAELHPLFKGLLWVSAARSTDETRYVICNIHIEKDESIWRLVATDGRRMHIHSFDPGLFEDDIDLIPEGLYEVVAKTSKVIVIAESECGEKYPNWRGVVPDYEPKTSVAITAQTISRLGIATGVLLAADFTIDAIGFGCGIKKDATAHIDFTACPTGPGAFVIGHELGKAIIMPMRLGDEQDETPKTDAESTPYMEGFAADEKDDDTPDDGTPRLFDSGKALKKFQKGCEETGSSVTIQYGDKSIEVTKDGIVTKGKSRKGEQ